MRRSDHSAPGSGPASPAGHGAGVAGATRPDDGLWGPTRRRTTVGLVLTITLVAFEALAIATVMPEVKSELGGLALYGWVFSGFFLGSLFGIVAAGLLADRRGLRLPFAAGLVLFCAGLLLGGAAGSMEVLVAGRVAQGLGAGAIPAVAYAAIGRSYPPALRPRMFATMSTAWVVPGLVGPAAAAVIEHALSWRWVFLGLLPFVLLAAAATLPALAAVDRGLGRPAPQGSGRADRRRLARVGVLVLGVGAVLAATTGVPVGAAVALAALGLPVAVRALLGLVPPGTLRLAPGVPATVGVRGLLTCAFFSADAYVTLAVTDGRGAATWVGGAALSLGSVLWAVGSWYQARVIDRVGPRRLNRDGFWLMALGTALLLAAALGAPVGLAVLAWGIGGLGMGVGYAPLSVTVLAAAEPGQEGTASAALQLSDTLGVAVGTGLGGAVVALGDARDLAVSTSVSTVFALSLALMLAGVLASRRLPAEIPSGVAPHPDGRSGATDVAPGVLPGHA